MHCLLKEALDPGDPSAKRSFIYFLNDHLTAANRCKLSNTGAHDTGADHGDTLDRCPRRRRKSFGELAGFFATEK